MIVKLVAAALLAVTLMGCVSDDGRAMPKQEMWWEVQK